MKNSADIILKYFSYFSQKIGFDISCKLSPGENNNFAKAYEKIRKYFKLSFAEIFMQHTKN